MSQPTSEQLARTFTRRIIDWLDNDTIAEVNRRNVLREYEGCCATHDFCDSNQAMIEALKTFGLEFDHNLIELINEAWDRAKQAGFAAANI